MSATENPLLKQLIDFGLSDKEAAIYLAALELEVGTAFEIAKHAGINRSSAYVVLEGLKKKGYVGVSDDKKVRSYIASSPEILLQSATHRAQKFEGIKQGIESILPELKALHKDTKRKPTVKVFEGKNGLINLFEDSLKAKEKKMRIISSVEQMLDLLPEYIPVYIQNRLKKGIKNIGIHPYTDFFRKYVPMDVNKLDEAIFIPEEAYKTTADFAIWDNKIGYMSPENGGFGVVIESKDMADTMKKVFDMAYEQAKILNKQIKQ